jgi:hypothetical protein
MIKFIPLDDLDVLACNVMKNSSWASDGIVVFSEKLNG